MFIKLLMALSETLPSRATTAADLSSRHLESPHLRDHEYALAEARWMLDLVNNPAKDISLEARQRIAEQTVENFAHHINAGFLEHRKSATLGGEFAFT